MPKGSTHQGKTKNYTINDLNQDLLDFDNFCKEQNIPVKSRLELLNPITSKIPKKALTRSTMVYWLLLLGATGLVALIVKKNWEPISWHITAMTRIIMIKALPFYDWRYLKDERCLLPNWFAPSPIKKSEEVFNCDLCESFKDFSDFLVEADGTKASDTVLQFIDLDRPVVMPGKINHWITDTPEDFVRQMLDKPDFSYSLPCNLLTNIYNYQRDDIDVHTLLDKVNKFDNVFLHFQNCDKAAMRIFRNYTYRPAVIPKEIAPVNYNWLIWNKNYNPSKYKKLNLIEKHTVMGQLFGSTLLKLIPRKNCGDVCEIIEGTLPAGFILIFTSLWDVEYLPRGENDNMAVVLEIR